jgi:DNA polymerase III subunit alpha
LNNYVVYHLHSDLSNPTAGTGADSATKFTQYLDRAAELNMKAIAFSEHGNIFNWVKKKEETEKRGLKYIHANEVYLTEHIDKERGLIRDNYHFMLIAKNFEGVKEINKLSSKSFNRKDGHFYYNPRITFEELFNTSDNIIMTSACLASPLWRAIKNNDKQKLQLFQDFFVKNKHRMFLEIQYHDHPEQIEYNRWLYNFSKETGIPLIAGTDTHSLNKEHLEARKILLKAKGATYGDEDTFDLTFKSFNELIEMFKKQSSIPKEAYEEAIHNTNVMADMVEEFTLDKSPKYPKLYDNPIEVFKDKINEGIKKRGIDKFEKEKKERYFNRIKEEFEVYKKLDAIDYMLLQKNIIDWCHKNEIYQGFGRGSVNGSLIAYLLGITEMDSIKHKLNFFRFMNPDRQSLADIDVDFPPSRRQDVIDYVANLKGIYFSEIVTFNTVALKGAIREVGRALKIPLSTVDEISKNVEIKEQYYREKYPELFKYVDLINGVVTSVGSHPSGFLVSPIPLEENVGLFYTNESKYAVSQINMKELEGLFYVKLDILGLDNIEIINETCKLIGIERLTPDNVNDEDMNVWNSLKESTLGIFQWESETAFNYIKQLLSNETITKIKKENSNYKLIDLLSVGNGAIRPSGESYRDRLANGIFNDNGHEGLNNLLHDTLGYLVYQEQIMKFLTDFCGFTPAESDNVRRGLAKKVGTEQFLPQIEKGFIKTMTEKYNETEDNAKKILEAFLKVISDASNYGFSVNHSQPYSYIGYICGYLRYYYPLEFLTVMLNINQDNIDKTAKIYQYAKQKGIQIKPIQFGKSKANYSLSKDENAIYKGIGSIKHLNNKIAEELYHLSQNQFNDFIDLLIDIEEKTSCNSRQLEILIKLNFFKQFGKNGKLFAIYEKFKQRYKKSHKDSTKQQRIKEIKDFAAELEDVEIPVQDQILFEKDTLGYGQTTFPKVSKAYGMVIDIDTKYSPKVTLYIMNNGLEFQLKVSKQHFYNNGEQLLNVGDIIKVVKVEKRPKKKLVDGKWVDTDVMEDWLVAWQMSKKYTKEAS